MGILKEERCEKPNEKKKRVTKGKKDEKMC